MPVGIVKTQLSQQVETQGYDYWHDITQSDISFIDF